MIMQTRREPRKDLAAKLHFLSLDPIAQEINGCQGVTSLAKKAGINVSTLKTLKSSANKDRISRKHEVALAKACGFDPDARAWRTGTVGEFREYYLNRAKRAERDGLAGPLRPRNGEQKAGGRLAALKMEAVQSNSGEQWPIKINLRCRAVDGCGIKRAFVDLNCGVAFALEEDLNFKQPYAVRGAGATIRLAAGTRNAPSWSVEASDSILDDVSPEERYCVVRGLADGGRIIASLSVYVKDVPSAEDYICRKDGKPLGRCNKKLVLDRIAAAALSYSDAGQVVLSSDEVIFECDRAGLDAMERAGG